MIRKQLVRCISLEHFLNLFEEGHGFLREGALSAAISLVTHPAEGSLTDCILLE